MWRPAVILGLNYMIWVVLAVYFAGMVLLGKTAELSLDQARRLSARRAGVYLYESWATLPLIAPSIFEQFVVPYNKRVISAVRAMIVRGCVSYNTTPENVLRFKDMCLQAGRG